MSFRARYEGVCADCDEPIQVCPSCWLEKSVTGACGCEEP